MPKTKITIQEVIDLSPDLILYAAPVMIGLALIEAYFSYRQNKGYYETKDFFASLAIGIVYILQSTFTKAVIFFLAVGLYNLVPWAIPVNWYTCILCFILLDFLRFFAHKIGHETSLFWATHVTHHNSEKFNLSTTFRLSWTQQIKIIFFLPISLLGFNPVIFFICHQLAVIYQFWLHTEYIRKTPRWFQYIFVTPSHHRVHHGRNDKYLNKNFGSTFIIWDRMFGTFQKEEEQSDYGVLNQPKGYNPIKLVFHIWVDIFKNMKKARSLKDAWKILVQPPEKLK